MENEKKKKIIIVEDDQSLQNALSEVISREGFEVESAFDGEEAIKTIGKYKPDLVLLDIILPKKNGYDVLQKLKKDPETKSIPVMILTNLEEVDNVQKALDLGATNYLVKSDFSLKDVMGKIREILK